MGSVFDMAAAVEGDDAIGMADGRQPVRDNQDGATCRDLFHIRLDHALASRSLGPTACRYRHEWRDARLSDHSALEADFAGPGVAAP